MACSLHRIKGRSHSHGANGHCAKMVHGQLHIHKVILNSGALDQKSNTWHSITMKLTSKSQVTVPVRIREFLQVAPQGEVDFLIKDDHVLLIKAVPESPERKRFAPFRGVLRDSKSTDAWMMDTRQSSCP